MRLIIYSLALLAAVSQAGLQVCASSGASNVVSSDGVRILRRTKNAMPHLSPVRRAGLAKSVVAVQPLLVTVDSNTLAGVLADAFSTPSTSDDIHVEGASGTTTAPSTSPDSINGPPIIPRSLPVRQTIDRRTCSPMPLPSMRCRCPSQTYCPRQDQCPAECVNLSTDDENCGQCRNKCPGTQSCHSGRCVCKNPNLATCGNECVNLLTSESHCGHCDIKCSSEQTCRDGFCKRSRN